jgi:hypothetical protein
MLPLMCTGKNAPSHGEIIPCGLHIAPLKVWGDVTKRQLALIILTP